ncbi:MAG: transcription-repair coupling factor [Clostridia bacterium]|nr:transcription-repair coupling factor [Clostridia bacterium]
MNAIIGELGKNPKFVDLAKQIENKRSPIAISGLVDVGISQIITAINEFNKKPICLVTYNEIQAKKIYEDLRYFSDKAVLFTKKEVVTYDYVVESKDLPYERIEALNKIVSKNNLIVVTTIEALMQKIPSEEVLYKNIIKFKMGEIYNLEDIKRQLTNLGYSRADMIEGKGQFSIRGGILDISQTESSGVRIEFWGDEVDSIRNFSISSQRSIGTLEKIEIYPAHEYILEKSIEEVCQTILDNEYTEKQQEKVDLDIEQIREGDYISKIDKYFESFYSQKSNLLDYLRKDYLIVLDEVSKIKQRSKNILENNLNLEKSLLEKEKLIPDSIRYAYNYDEIEEKFNANRQLLYLQKNDSEVKFQAEKYEFKYREVNYYKSEIEEFFKDIRKYINEKKKVYILVNSKDKAKKLKDLLEKEEIICNIEEKLNQTIIVKSSEGIVTIGIGKISTGFQCFEIDEVVIEADDLIDGSKVKRKLQSAAFKEGEKVVFADLKVGDYVVHKQYGIGIYIGVNTITADNTTKDYIKIKYLNEDILYVPTNQLDSIRKYIGGDSINPKINRLGSKEWENTKAKVKKNLKEIAKDLIELYAKREKTKGFAFSPDTPWQSEFEEKFPYTETDDQLRCIEEVKSDMEAVKPMDRLLCGDVGYGKTEVAIRAAFKAVMDQKQVAYLAPTTVLASQQYQEFKERMKDFPIRVELLNRFKTKKYQDEVIRKLKLGEVDIVIGTHRLLSKDVEFKDLGLLIIDEEHRFGVRDKEKIKQYKTSVDVLTMTATPIPRTMHMSIVGVRDMSVIYEPPHNRKPVQTYVLEYDEEVIREAIIKELERSGQVFYLFNNVEHIERKANEISRLVPEAKVTFAHGQMTGSKIEEIMKDFVEGNSNVLVCTTILESGIDIPNANTIIVENADRMGLAQLYQIRGRVGRADRQGYAYITYKRDKLLTEIADKRLKAIKEFTEFGSGFKIAMRDLEIRGAGSLLGEIQSGHLEQVGYETYCKLLDEVVKEMQGIKTEEEIDVQIDLNVTSYIPESYIQDSSQKIEVYQNIALCRNEEDIGNVIDEIIDRFGNMPEELESLIDIARIKYLCKDLNISKVAQKQDKLLLTFESGKFDYDINEFLKYYKDIKFSPGIKTMLTANMNYKSEKELLNYVIQFLKILKNTRKDVIM